MPSHRKKVKNTSQHDDDDQVIFIIKHAGKLLQITQQKPETKANHANEIREAEGQGRESKREGGREEGREKETSAPQTWPRQLH